MAIDVADDAFSAEDECGRLLEHLDISARARFPTEVERTGKTQDLGEIGNAAEVGAHQQRRSEELDGEAVGLDLLGDMPGRRGGPSPPARPEIGRHAREAAPRTRRLMPAIEEMAKFVGDC